MTRVTDHSLCKTWTRLSCLVNTVAADILMAQSAMAWTKLARNISASWARFTNNFSIVIQIRWKIDLSVTSAWCSISLNFAHATTAQLSCHVQNFIAITLLYRRWQQNEISIEFELRWENRSWNGTQLKKGQRVRHRQVETNIYTIHIGMIDDNWLISDHFNDPYNAILVNYMESGIRFYWYLFFTLHRRQIWFSCSDQAPQVSSVWE